MPHGFQMLGYFLRHICNGFLNIAYRSMDVLQFPFPLVVSFILAPLTFQTIAFRYQPDIAGLIKHSALYPAGINMVFEAGSAKA
jgi:hypothetical protein